MTGGTRIMMSGTIDLRWLLQRESKETSLHRRDTRADEAKSFGSRGLKTLSKSSGIEKRFPTGVKKVRFTGDFTSTRRKRPPERSLRVSPVMRVWRRTQKIARNCSWLSGGLVLVRGEDGNGNLSRCHIHQNPLDLLTARTTNTSTVNGDTSTNYGSVFPFTTTRSSRPSRPRSHNPHPSLHPIRPPSEPLCISLDASQLASLQPSAFEASFFVAYPS